MVRGRKETHGDMGWKSREGFVGNAQQEWDEQRQVGHAPCNAL